MPNMVSFYINISIEDYCKSFVFEVIKKTLNSENWIILHSYNLLNIDTYIGRKIDLLALYQKREYLYLKLKMGKV
jgi:hypothetical protein